jgi:pimeloyl-ACP methyl ester carboxylesterase/carbonic anhydrase
MTLHRFPIRFVAAALMLTGVADAQARPAGDPQSEVRQTAPSAPASQVQYKTIKVNGLDIFYREAGPKAAPTILLLHGFPSSSSMFRNLIPALSDKYHVIAPDYPGFGRSSQPPASEFAYTFDNLAGIVNGFTEQLGLKQFAIYVQDYGAPVGYRIATAHPDRITGIIVQNGNAYVEGLPDGFWAPLKEYWKNPTPELRTKLEGFLSLETTKWQYLHGARDPQNISPDAYLADQAVLDRPGNKDVQIALFKDYGSNPPLYPAWQEYFRKHQPPTLIVWGKNDQIFPPAGAEPYKRDLKNIDFNLLDTGHFALEEDGDLIAKKIRTWMEREVDKRAAVVPAPAEGFGRYVFSKAPGFTDEGFYRAFKKAVPIRTMVVNCMDPRCVRVPEVVAKAMPGEVYPGELILDEQGRKVGGTATILPVVVAGGRAVDALRSITVAQHLFDIQNIVVVHHTNCGASSYTPEGLTAAYLKEQGRDIAQTYNRRDLAISDLEGSLRDDVKVLRDAPGIPAKATISAYVYNIDTEQLTLIAQDRGSSTATGK